MGSPFGFMAFLGIASLIGVIVSHVIVLFNFIEEMHQKGEPFEQAIRAAGIERLRPVLRASRFERALNQVWNHAHGLLTGYRAEHHDGEICVTGHSLGGALALLAYSRFQDSNTVCYTFGCPRVGNSAFGQSVAESPGKGHFRFVNEEDTVAHVPPKAMLYSHAPARHYRFGSLGQLDQSDNDTLAGDVAAGAAIAALPVMLGTMRRVGETISVPGPGFADSALLAILSAPAAGGLVDHSVARYGTRIRA